MPTPMRAAFVGLGAMGQHMARNLHRAGMLSAVWNRSADKARDRKSTRLNSSHSQISYAVFCLQKTNLHSQVFHCPPVRAHSQPDFPPPSLTLLYRPRLAFRVITSASIPDSARHDATLSPVTKP